VIHWLLALLLLLTPQSTVDPLRIAVVGDSISCSPTNPAWCPELSRLLITAGVDHVLLPLAVGGTRCDYWASHVADVLDDADILILGCGTNDGAAQLPASQVQAAVESIAAQADDADVLLLGGVPSYSSGAPTNRPDLPVWQHEAYAGITAAWATFAAAYGPDFSPAMFDDTRLPSLMRFKVGDGVHSTPAGDLVYAHNRYRALQAFIPGMPNIAPDCMQIGHPPGEPIPRGIPCYGRPGV
jgi:lysophospholipase L1-like esterase